MVQGFDYNTHFIETGENPANFVFKEDIEYFPKIQKLRQLKNENIAKSKLHPPLHVKADLRESDLCELLRCRFDVILVDPPWYEYHVRAGGFPPKCSHKESVAPWSFEEIQSLPIELISSSPSFCFIWCGNKHVEQATACLLKWGFRRIEDICWVKTNEGNATGSGLTDYLPYGSLTVLKNTKEHLLVGIKGTVQRSRDSHLIHANIDSDVVIAPQEPEFGCTRKPEEVYDIIERFCNSQRRLELFGQDHNLRHGWVTVGRDITRPTNYDPVAYNHLFEMPGAEQYIPSTAEIEKLRPKSPKSAYAHSTVLSSGASFDIS